MSQALSSEQFLNLFNLFKHGNEKVLANLVAANQGLIGYVADRHATRLHSGKFRDGLQSLIDWEDLMQAGNVGLLIALKRFDPSRGVQFSTYANDWIDKHIRLFINSCLLIKTARFQFRSVAAFEQRHDKDHWHSLRKDIQCREERNEAIDLVRQMLELLPERSREILKLRFGLDDGVEHQIGTIVERCGLNRFTIRKIINRSLANMKIAYERYERTGKISLPTK